MVYLGVNEHAGTVDRPSPSLLELAADLLATQRALHDVLAGLDPDGWDRPTPAPGWGVRHQVRHLAQGEELGRLAATDPGGFAVELARLLGDLAAVEAATTGDGDGPGEADADLLARWWEAAGGLRDAVLAGPPGERIGWVAGPMSRASFLTARVMETFAHGHDVGVALGVEVPADRALAHVAHLGWATRRFAYANRGLPVPETDLRLELTGAGGLVCGPADAADVVRGPTLDLCLVVTRRVHPDDTALEAAGPHAREWLGLAQCFAGPPTDGPPPGRR